MPRGSVLIDEGSGQKVQLFERWSDYISRVWVEEGTIFRRNHPSLVNLFCWDEVVLIRALLECSVSKKTRGHTRRIEQKWSRPKSPFLWLIRSPSVKKVRKNKKKWKKEGHIGNLSDMTGANIFWHSTFKIGAADFRIFARSVVTVNRAEITALMCENWAFMSFPVCSSGFGIR